MHKKVNKTYIVYFALTACFMGLILFPNLTSAAKYMHNSPSFTVTYPDGYNIKTNIYDNQILWAADPTGTPELHVSVGDIPEGAENSEDMAKVYSEGLNAVGTDAQIISSKQIILKNNQAAQEGLFKWKYAGQWPMESLVVFAIRNNKVITIGAHTNKEIGEVEINMAHSLELAGNIAYDNQAPAFSVTYPDHYKPQAFQDPSEVLRVRCSGRNLVVYVGDAGENQKIEDTGNAYINALKSSPVASDVKLVSSEPATLKDQSAARMHAVEWKWNALPMKSLVLSTYKDNRSITAAVHSWVMGVQGWDCSMGDEAKEILSSFQFK